MGLIGSRRNKPQSRIRYPNRRQRRYAFETRGTVLERLSRLLKKAYGKELPNLVPRMALLETING